MDEKGALLKPPDMDAMRRDIFAVSIGDAETRETIGEVYRAHETLLEPHGAVGWAGLDRYLDANPESLETAICLETAHPAKFPDEVKKHTGVEPGVPPSLAGLDGREESYDSLDVSYEDFKDYLMESYGK
jgi:threonine synthase